MVLNRNGPFICDRCEATFTNRLSFLRHFGDSHRRRKAVTTMFCDLCPRTFRLKSVLLHHIRRDHHKLRPFKCGVCGHKSSTKSNFEIHMMQHAPKKKCKICEKFVKNMNTHLLTHIKVKCKICDEMIPKRSFSVHTRGHKRK